ARLSPEEVRLSRIGRFIWLRLDVHPAVRPRSRSITTNLVFRLATDPTSPFPSPPFREPPTHPPPPPSRNPQERAPSLVLQRPLEQRHRQRQRRHRKNRQINHVRNNRHQPRFLQQQRFESMHRIGKRIHFGNRPQPR